MTDSNGAVTEYRTPNFKDDPAKASASGGWIAWTATAGPLTTFIRRTMPSILLWKPAESTRNSMGQIQGGRGPGQALCDQAEGLAADRRFFTRSLPNPAQSEPVIKEAQAIYRANFFPEVKLDWRTHPNFVGHKNWDGCFRCHDGKHIAADGKTSIKASDCRSCHLILAQGSGEALNQISATGHDFIHIDSEYSEFSCTDCHTGGVQK